MGRSPDAMSERAPDPDRTIEAKLFRGLADPARLGILLEIRRSPRTAGELATALDISPSNASNHLRCLLECGLVKVESSGRYNLYRLADPSVRRLLDASRMLLSVVAPEIEACLNYGPPDRRALRSFAGASLRQEADQPAP